MKKYLNLKIKIFNHIIPNYLHLNLIIHYLIINIFIHYLIINIYININQSKITKYQFLIQEIFLFNIIKLKNQKLKGNIIKLKNYKLKENILIIQKQNHK